ncbi:DsbC family protein [Carnimonas bestiolae]|uniref:DsbC family protein n=1 Tax=Carnimonas bestiolae TaxID=3402172 RepID=UPI003EDB7825
MFVFGFRRLAIAAIACAGAMGIVSPVIAASAPDISSLTIGGRKVAVTDARETPIRGLYRLTLESGDVVFSDPQGHYMLTGDLYENGEHGLINLSEKAANEQRREALAKLDKRDSVIFRPAGDIKGTLTVFTDITCPYCQELHKEIPTLNKQGIAVRYLAFPRAGDHSPAAAELAQIWCSRNPQQSMSAAFNGKMPDNSGKQCASTISRDYELGRQLGVQGTPAIVYPDGSLVPGYLPAGQLVSHFKQHAQ